MTTEAQPTPEPQSPKPNLSIKTFGIGGAGIKVIEQLIPDRLSGMSFVALDTDAMSISGSSAGEKAHLETKMLRGLGTGGDPERGAAAAEEHGPRLRALCEGTDVVFIVVGLGGGAGTGIGPVLARTAKQAGALVLGFVALPFDCEGSRRARLAMEGLAELKAAADGVVCLTNQKVFKLIDENTSVLETFKFTAGLLADATRGIWRLLAHSGLLEIHFNDVCELLRDRHLESCFAVAEAMGATRSREVVDKLLAHPMLDGGKHLNDAEAVLISLSGGPDLTMAEVNRVMEQIRDHCEHAQVIMGAAIDENLIDRMAVTLIAARKAPQPVSSPTRLGGQAEDLHSQLLPASAGARPHSRFVPPAPSLAPEKLQQLMARQGGGGARQRRNSSKVQQGQLPLEIVSKGRFDKSEPTIHKGEDLDVPTYIRRGVPLN